MQGMIQVRPCSAEDFDAVVSLLAQLWPNDIFQPASLRKVFDRVLTSERQFYLCAEDDGKVIGFGSLTLKNNLWPQGPVGNVDELVVDAGYRGRGVGKRLLDELTSLAQTKGCRRFELDSGHHRKEAHAFYARQGFENRACLFSKVLKPG